MFRQVELESVKMCVREGHIKNQLFYIARVARVSADSSGDSFLHNIVKFGKKSARNFAKSVILDEK